MASLTTVLVRGDDGTDYLICAHLLQAAHALREIIRHDCNTILCQGTHGYLSY